MSNGNVMALEEQGGVRLDFSPTREYKKPDDMFAIHQRSNNGTLYSYRIYCKRRWEVPLSQLDKTTADQINTWWLNLTNLKFYPDIINLPAEFYNVRITDNDRPLSGMTDWAWETLYEGSMKVQEI
jgi:hypothetical protein